MNKNNIIIKICALVAICLMSNTVKAQEFIIQGDLVSSYVWRGMYQTGASIQPTLGFKIQNFSIIAWGSTDFDGVSSSANAAAKEIDLTAAYTIGNSGLTVSLADLWWAGQGANNYFNFKNDVTAHHLEAGLNYTIQSKKFPLSVAWYTMFAGQDKDKAGKQNYSSYVELNFPFKVKIVDLNVTCGIVPYSAPIYNCDGFAVTNVALKGTVGIKISDKFTLPIFAQAIWNPRVEDSHIVFGLTLKP